MKVLQLDFILLQQRLSPQAFLSAIGDIQKSGRRHIGSARSLWITHRD
jgi:hypothetical protein